MKGRTLRAKLLRLLLLPLGLLWALNAIATFLSVRDLIDQAFDRALQAAALAIAERVKLSGTTPIVDIPPVALEVLDTAAQERIFYRVSYRVEGGPATFVTGYADLPEPVGRVGAVPIYYDARYRGDPVRVSAVEAEYPTQPRVAVLVLVAETVGGRDGRTLDLVSRQLGSQLILILLALVIVWFGVWSGLRPLVAVSREVAHRSELDLSPVDPRKVPKEVLTLVSAVNDLMSRLRATLAAQGRFIADAAHALRTPLAVLHTEAELALRQDDGEPMRAAVARLRDHSEATTRLARQLLTLARVEHSTEQLAIGEIDLGAMAREVCASLVPEAIARGLDLGFEGGEAEPLRVRGRDPQLRELIVNLVDNAMRYGARNGAITVSIALSQGGEVCLAVEDEGPGIPPDERDRVLQPFYRRPGSPGDGAGLGLAIVNEIARGHGAALRLLDGHGGRGLRAEVHLPRA